MRARVLTLVAAFQLLAGASRAHAEEDAEWVLQVAGKQATAANGLDRDPAQLAPRTRLTVTCRNKDCTTVKVAVGGASLEPAGPASPGVVHFDLSPDAAPAGARLEVTWGKGTAAGSFTRALSAAPAASGARTGETRRTLAEVDVQNVSLSQLVAQCQAGAPPPRGAAYDSRADRARVVLSPLGNLLSAAPVHFDENDALEVTVYADRRLLALLHVVRKSEFRPVGGLSILGAGIDVPRELTRQEALGPAEADNPCGAYTVTLTDFAPGKGEVEIRALAANGSSSQEIAIGTYEFNVDRLYSGMFSLGALWTPQGNPRFGLRAEGDGQVIFAKEDGDRDVLYALFYTPFVQGKRDIEKPLSLLSLERLNPSVGIVLNAPLDHALAGLSYDLDYGIVLTGGLVLSRVRQLSGVDEGDAFAGTADQIPTSRRWKGDVFLAVSVDLRAAVELLRSSLAAGR